MLLLLENRLSKKFVKELEKHETELKYRKMLSRKKYDYCANYVAQNYLFIFGAKPGKFILANTQMVFEIAYYMTQDYEKETLSIQIPRFFDFFKG